MANTEGLTDEVMSSMLAMPSPEEDRQQRAIGGVPTKQTSQSFPLRAMSRREQMMELGEGETPAATVIRTSKAPKIHSSSATKRRTGKAVDSDVVPFEQIISAEEAKISDEHEKMEAISDDRTYNNANQSHKPVMSLDFIRERPIGTPAVEDSDNKQKRTKPRESRFKQRNRTKNNGNNNILGGEPTAGGFPSLDAAPVGTFTRKGRSSARVRQSPTVSNTGAKSNLSNSIMPSSNTHTKTINEGNDVGMTSDAMLANMSLEDIREGVEEAKSILSAGSIAFLRKRGQQKLAKSKELFSNTDTVTLPKNEAFDQDEKKVKDKEEKEKMAELLSSVRSPEDMNRVYNEALQLGLAAELPSSSLVSREEECMSDRMKNLHIASSLLRSTAPRQRLLGARSLCDILEEDVHELAERRRAHLYSDSCDDRGSMQKKYPQFMPVAIRCLLDESIATYQTAGGRLLLSIVLRCIHALMTLCVHPYHVVNVSPTTTTGCEPFILHQTCFMSDVSHLPLGTELYPPTQIKPIDNATNAACYRTDSSAATAESDSKAFYNDPAWTLLSRMRILPCLSDVMTCLSTDYSAGLTISDTTIQSICGILAMLTVRSPGAAGAIARHKGILPFMVSYCLSPPNGTTSNDNNNGLFNTGAALPALILLCHLARQSRDIAELEMPFQTIMPDLQAILCLEAETEDESRIQMWSIILLRILMRYGLGAEHVQSIIRMLAPRAELMNTTSSLGSHYLMLFASICDASKIKQKNGQNMPTISEADECLAMTGVWLSSSVRYCTTSFQSSLDSCDNNHMTLATAQLRFLASYISTATPTMNRTSIPIVSQEACFEVIERVLESAMINRALTTALAISFNAYWVNISQSNLITEDEAVSCAFVTSFMSFVKVVGVSNLGQLLKAKLFKKISSTLSRFSSVDLLSPISMQECSNIHPARQSWHIESEFAVLEIVFEESKRLRDESFRNLIAAFSFSLLGRLNIGNEALAAFIFRQEALFKAKDDEADQTESILQKLFLLELSSSDDRQLQLNHSSNLMNDSDGALSSLRCAADFVGGSDGERFFLPLGPLWMWNVLSSTMTSQSSALPNDDQSRVSDIVSHTLLILLQLENTSIKSRYSNSIKDGTKLYHITNVCLFPEKTLSSVESILTLLFKQFNTSALVSDYIKACFEHSRLYRESKLTSSRDKGIGSTEEALQSLFTTGGDQSSSTEDYSKDELRALDDFVDDLGNAYIEYGGQYAIFTYFIRLFFRHDFPPKVITSVLTKLHPILNVLTIEDEDSSTLHSSLSQSISGGLPSSDSSRRDPGSLLDSFSSALKEINNKELLRNDYMYLLAVAILSRNLASSSQRCECGLEAMKNRLSGVSDSVFYDIAQVSEKFLHNVNGTKTVLVTCVLDVCTDSNCGLLAQDIDTQNKWRWTNSNNRDAVWNQAIAACKTC